MSRRFAALLALVSLAPGAAVSAQAIRGRVTDAATRQPIGGALIELRDTSGTSIRIILTSASGNFVVESPGPGRYLLRAAAIGFVPRPLRPVDVPPEGVVVPEIGLSRMVTRLPDLVFRAYCGQTAVTDATFGRLLESAHDALRIIEQTIRNREISFTVALLHTNIYFGQFTNITVADTTLQPLAIWPVSSINHDTLRVVGFGRTLVPNDESTRKYYGPDPAVLFSDWFVNSHCFKLGRVEQGSDALRVTFAPARKTKLVDISGELVLDAASLSLRQFTWTLLNLPDWMPDAAAGGEMQFAQHSSGAWITTGWALWAPIIGVPPRGGRYSVAGLAEVRGVVVRVVARDTAGRVQR